MPRSKGRPRESRNARATRAAQRRADERRRVSHRRSVFLRAAGWSLVGLGVVIGASHWLTHIQVWGFASQGVMDLVAGYPMAAALGVGGAVVLSKT
jgi:hypothetical protein